MPEAVAAFTDTYLPTVNGVSYTVSGWRDCWRDRGGRMDVVYPRADGYRPDDGEHPVASLPFPFYEGFRIAGPWVPDAVAEAGADVVHAHTPFGLGLAGARFAKREGLPLVASFHTPTSEYTRYVASGRLADGLAAVNERWQRRFFSRADAVVVPTAATGRHVTQSLGVDAPIEVVPNGVDVDLFRPVDPAAFLERHGIDTEEPIVGYTGRQGYEKSLDELLSAAAGMDVTVLLGGDGPAREDLRERAGELGLDAHFPGFLDREELPAFYSALDVFAFPSPVETQGLVALEAYACGTPVVGCDAGALVETIDEGETGYRYESGDVEGFRAALRRALDEREALSERCLDRREEIAVERSVDRLAALYAGL